MNTTATLPRPAPLAIPEPLRRNIHFILGDTADAWLDDSVKIAHRLAAEWSVLPESVLEGGAMSLVVLCSDEAGTPVVLKIPASRIMGTAESDALAAWNNGAVPRLLGRDAATGSFLMEFIVAGTAVMSSDNINAVLARLHTPARTGMQALDDVLRPRIDGAVQRFAGPSFAKERHCLDLAVTVITALQETADQTMVHGDFQAKNVLPGKSGPVAIDPLPAVGDRFSDLGLWIAGGSAGARSQALWKFTATSPDPRRLLAWAWALSVLEYRPGLPGSEDAADFIAGNLGTAADAARVPAGSPVGALRA